jgi:signal recognition particle subunit SRP54
MGGGMFGGGGNRGQQQRPAPNPSFGPSWRGQSTAKKLGSPDKPGPSGGKKKKKGKGFG